MDNRRFLLALFLSVLVLVVWQSVFAPPPPAPEETPAGEAPGAPPATEVEPGVPAPLEVETEIPSPAAVDEAIPGAVEEAAVERIEAAAEKVWRYETATVSAELTNRGGQLLSYRLKQHRSADGGPVDLVRARAEGPYPLALITPSGQPSPLNEALFVGEKSPAGEGAEAITLRYAGPAGRATKRLVFRPDGLIELELEVAGGGAVLLGPGLRNPTADELENRFARRSAVYSTGEDVERVDPQKTDGPVAVPGAGLRWAGLQDTYFLAAMVFRAPVRGVLFEPVLLEPSLDAAPRFLPMPPGGELTDAQEDLVRELAARVEIEGDELSAVAFFGAKRYSRLEALPFDLERTVELGIFGFLARPLLWGLAWIHDTLVGNYGWAIILMTVLIRILLFPLTHKSVVSMQKMQDLNPKIQAIRQKYRPKLKDKQGRPNAEMQRKMNEEIMALYKKEGVNPAGGCLPMLLQIPVLFAFYSLLSTAVELRHAPWILWIEDLAAPDPYYVLPIVMGASQFLQQRLTPTSADPMQRRIFMLMPIFFTVLFLGFPSGLVLYWLTNNVLGIAQQMVYKRLQEDRQPAKPAKEARRSSSKEKAKG